MLGLAVVVVVDEEEGCNLPRTPKALRLVSMKIRPFSDFVILESTIAAAPAILPSNPRLATHVVPSLASSTNPRSG